VILLGYRIGYILLVDMTNAGISLSNVSPWIASLFDIMVY
jgi:hypothetical protein